MSNPAEGYERFMVPTLFGPWAAHLIQAADPRPGERVLDVVIPFHALRAGARP